MIRTEDLSDNCTISNIIRMNNNSSFKNINEFPPANSLESVSRSFNIVGLDFGYCTVGELETKRTFTL
jgi:hypothetical protein